MTAAAATRLPRPFAAIPVLLLCLAFLTLLAAPAHAQGGGGSNLTYITYPGEYLYDVARKLETSGSVIRWLNPGKIGPRGRLEPYTRLLIPTSRANRGKVIGAKPPRQVKPTSPKPFKKPIVPATQPSAPPANTPAAPTLPPEDPPAVTYDTRSSGFEYKTEVGPATYARLILAPIVVLCLLYGLARYVRKRKGLTGTPTVTANPQTPQPKADVPAPTQTPSFGAHLDAATQARESSPEESADEPPAEILSLALLEPEEKTNTPNRVEAAEPDPVALEKSLTDTQEIEPPDFSNYVDDDIPQTSLADALRGRRKRF